MKQKCKRITTIWILAVFCSLMLAAAAWADETTVPGSSVTEVPGSSRVIVSGAAAAREAEDQAARSNYGPAAPPAPVGPVTPLGRKGTSLGMFSTTGYCPGECCGGGSGKTYSGTIPQANHTVSADLAKFPIGTKLMINDIIYTVEDIGSSVVGNCIDIFYNTHEEAMAHGRKQEEVFTVVFE